LPQDDGGRNNSPHKSYVLLVVENPAMDAGVNLGGRTIGGMTDLFVD